ncbi:MAG: hypothetical protein M3N49_10725, partial [Candidatus Eremiobacteraeota bacterium]|nr:hypothetical protein [Candidatus Eremiobacteraeota bacterium]
MKERENTGNHRPRVVTEDALDERLVTHQVAVGQHDALGRSRRSGRVLNQRDVTRRRASERVRSRRARRQRRHGTNRRTGRYPHRALQRVDAVGARQDDARLGVACNRREPVESRPVALHARRHGDDAGDLAAEKRLDELTFRVERQNNAVAGSDDLPQAMRDRIRILPQVAERQLVTLAAVAAQERKGRCVGPVAGPPREPVDNRVVVLVFMLR